MVSQISFVYTWTVNEPNLTGIIRFVHATGSSGVVLSRDRMRERRDYLILPASVFLMLV